MQDQREVVTITHPEIQHSATCTRRQFERLYKDRGWAIDADTDKVMATSVSTKPPPRFERRADRVKGEWPPKVRGAQNSKAAAKAAADGGEN